MIGVSACTSTPGAQSLAVSPPSYSPTQAVYSRVAENAMSADATVAPTRTADSDRADFMPVGGPVSAPMGFLDLCQRSPADCQHSGVYNPDKIRTLARTATVERYALAFATLHRNSPADANADMQSASVSPPADNDAPAAASGSVPYLTWPAQGSGAPLSYAPPLRQDGLPGPLTLPGLVAPAANGYVSDFLDLTVNPGGWTQLGAATPAPAHLAGDVQPGAVSGGDADGATLTWSHKSDTTNMAAVVPVSVDATRAPSIQYDIPNEPYDWAHVHLPAQPAQPGDTPSMRAAAEADQSPRQTAQAEGAPDTSDYVRIDLNARNANIIRQVNDQVNRIMRGATDWEVYHVADYWNAPPLVPGVRGDCEDFALEKRRLLIENGIPAAALSIAIVRTRLGEDHAVLIVSSWQGDYVLDNLQYDVRSWRKAGYTWISRQGPGDDLAWVSLAPANSRTRSPWQANTVRVAYNQ